MKENSLILCAEFISFVTRDSHTQEINSNDVCKIANLENVIT
jgi:hypothetical protein